MMKWEAEQKGYTCNDCYLSMQNCHDKRICCEDETGLCDSLRSWQIKENKMDNDLISRQAVSSWLKQYGQDVLHGKYKFSLIYIWKNLMDLPPAQPEPHEWHWIWVAGDLECSKCHTRYPDLYPDYDNSVACPHCGAKMKGATT